MAVFPRSRAALPCALLLALAACSHQTGLPSPDSREYRELVHAFNVGLSALQCSEDVRAKTDLTRASQLAPGEPAVWADLGLLAMRQQEFEAALANMDKARELAPENSQIEFYLGDIESKRGHLPEAIQHFRKAVDLDGRNVKALYSLAEETERQGGGGDALGYLKRILEQQPANVEVLLEVARLSAKSGDAATLRDAVARLSQESVSWPSEVREQMKTLSDAASGPAVSAAAVRVAFLRNVLLRVPAYRANAEAVKTPPASAGEPFVKFMKLPSPSSEPADADTETAFVSQALVGVPSSGVAWVRPVYLDGEGRQSLMWSDGAGLHVGGAVLKTGSTARDSVAVADLNFDFRNDVVVAGPSVQVYQQQEGGRFAAPKTITKGSFTGVWPFDFDLDGDLDLIVGVKDAPPLILRNNGDGSFAQVHPFAVPMSLVSFAVADVEGAGAPDVAMVGADGRLAVYMNDRRGQFRERAVPANVAGGVTAVAEGDIDSDGLLDFVLLKRDGVVMRLSDKNGKWETAEIARTNAGAMTLAVADLDNNGSLDIVAGSSVFLGSAHGFTRVNRVPAMTDADVMDVNGDGLADLVGLDAAGAPVALINHGTKNYKWQEVRLRAANVYGDQRINSFGLGGEIEIRTGMLTEKQIIAGPVVHFGLGEHDGTDVARILWPNGLLQVEFELKPNQTVLAAQRLKGSCPSLFAWDGHRMSFVKDAAPLATGLGEEIPRTEEWYKVPGSAVQPRDGFYDLRVTDELWESYYVDSYSLMVVDHPRGTEVFSDERFPLPPHARLYTTTAPRPFRAVTDDNGRDVSAVVRDVDEKYLDTFGRGRFQGVTRDHWVELELPVDAPRTGPLYLIADGWMHPTDASIDLAIQQGGGPKEQSLRIEVQDARGRWVTSRRDLGYPASKRKTMVIDVTGLPRRFRLATNMEIFWDRLAWAAGVSNDVVKTQRLAPASAELLRRGFSVMETANASSPEMPDYDRLEGSGQKWRAIEGYYTRYGDVRELLARADDRYVIMGSSDEVRVKFAAPAPPPAGWVRDFIMIGDGWIKDGDYNSAYSSTVLPLPYHGMKSYTSPPGRLEDDPEYRRHANDWQLFHTRYEAPEALRSALWK